MQQQTVLRVQTNIPGTISGTTKFENLDLYGDIPIKINKSFAELQDISKRNSDYSIGFLLPGSKKNNAFFENFFDVDTQSLFFNATLRVNCNVLLDDVSFFEGYMRLNKVSVLNSKVEYDVTLYSNIGDLFGKIGTGLLQDLNFSDTEYTFNHIFSLENVVSAHTLTNFAINGEQPLPFIYPIIHNGYNYSGNSINQSGTTLDAPQIDQTRLMNSSTPIGAYTNAAAAWAAQVKQYQINSPTQGILDNQLKPALSIWNLMKLMFKEAGYTISGDFFNTPWMKTLYLYGYFSSELTKFSYTINSIEILPIEQVSVIVYSASTQSFVVVKTGSGGIPCYCASPIQLSVYTNTDLFDGYIPAGTSGYTVNGSILFDFDVNVPSCIDGAAGCKLAYLPKKVGDTTPFLDGIPVDFKLVVDKNIKQIDLLSSIAKKFNLVFTINPDNPTDIIIEPYNYYIGTGNIYDWTQKISYDQGFTVEPALNYIESQITITDLEDNDDGNKQFKDRNNRIYGQNYAYNNTDFKATEKKIETTFSPELIRKWDKNIGLPLGINYAGSTSDNGTAAAPTYFYKGVKTKPKLFYWLGAFNPFLDIVGETFNASYTATTYSFYISNATATGYTKENTAPIISHTMPIGNPDTNKINNDSLCILFNSELPTDQGTSAYNVYTENDMYKIFYQSRIDNLYNPNTRFLNGYFDLKYNDIYNLTPKDLIKVNDQYFTWNKIDSYNLTNRELTKVELIQSNLNPQVYPDRYFKYFYCSVPGTVYKFKTNFTEPNLLNTNYGWSVLYDHNIGQISGATTGYTSTFTDTISGVTRYIGYTIYEVSKSDYESSGTYWTSDCLHNYIYSLPNGPFKDAMPTFWINSGSTTTGTNLFTGCTAFQTAVSQYGILTGSSTTHCVTPTPTPTITPTPIGWTAATSFSQNQVCTDPEAPSYTFFRKVSGGASGTTMCDMNQITGLWIDLNGPDCMSSPCLFYTYDGSNVKTWQILLSNQGYYYAIQYEPCGLCATPTPTPTPTGTHTPTPTPTSTPTPTPTGTPAPIGQCYCYDIVVTGTTQPGPEPGVIASIDYNNCYGVLTTTSYMAGPGTYKLCIQRFGGVIQYFNATGIDESYITGVGNGNCNTGYVCTGYTPAATATPTPTPTTTPLPPTHTPTPTPTGTPTPTPTPTGTPTPTPTSTPVINNIQMYSGTSVSSACSNTVDLTYYYVGSFGTGTVLYTDSGLINKVPGTVGSPRYYRYGNDVYSVTDSEGTLNAPVPCPTPTPTPTPLPTVFSAYFTDSSADDACAHINGFGTFNFNGFGGTTLCTVTSIQAAVISSEIPIGGEFWLSSGTSVRMFNRSGSTSTAYPAGDCTTCPTATPTPTPTATPLPPTYTPTPTPTGTPTPTPTSTPVPFSGTIYYGTTIASVCPYGSGSSGFVTGDGTTFCGSSYFTGNTFAYQSSGSYYMNYNGNVVLITITYGSNVVSVNSACLSCPTPTPTGTPTPTPTSTPTPTATPTPGSLVELTISRGTTGSSGTACNGTGTLYTVYNSTGALYGGGTVYVDALGDVPFNGGNNYYGDGSNYGRINASGTYTDAGTCL
jgi:hypothetical protein